MDPKGHQDTYQLVKEHYSAIARGPSDDAVNANVARAFGYTVEELQSVPSGNLGLGCGAPVAQAKLKLADTVLDLGSGGGFDVFLASKTAGRVIGVEMSQDMISLAQRNAEKLKKTNVEFVYSKLPQIALEDGIIDCVMSNCVINLIPHDEKSKVFQEMYRVLKPGGRVVLSDVLAREPLSEEIRADVALYVGCVAGASQITEYEEWLRAAGFRDIVIADAGHDLNSFRDNGCCAPSVTLEGRNSACGDGFCGTRDDKPADGRTRRSPGVNGGTCPSNEETIELEVPEGPFSCCSPRKVRDATGKPSIEESIVKDLNEWVGSFVIFSIKPTE